MLSASGQRPSNRTIDRFHNSDSRLVYRSVSKLIIVDILDAFGAHYWICRVWKRWVSAKDFGGVDHLSLDLTHYLATQNPLCQIQLVVTSITLCPKSTMPESAYCYPTPLVPESLVALWRKLVYHAKPNCVWRRVTTVHVTDEPWTGMSGLAWRSVFWRWVRSPFVDMNVDLTVTLRHQHKGTTGPEARLEEE